ncbi:FAD-dependent oxidoreductase [Sulfitobacter sp. SK012]|uniref:NAD(P)/FAD-dependent oxidoreductase n=1 Tax=Sulfitobacter sp. SK012 TaxID=1389005 RepID=UPI000E0B6489|nr:FAD-dependent oxidoreductase [Sulfitobacter sp. SK012]AXI48612.1 FAD-dependent oxidoreductase [Sulfitobacter sp. SK012]
MKRIFAPFAYSDAPRVKCWWDETAEPVARKVLEGDRDVDVAIIGAGFTGLSAALHLAEGGVRVAVLERRCVGWGASGRNGGFCCLGGSMLGSAALDAQFGRAGRMAYRASELAAIETVDELISRLNLDVDRHSQGETQLAHRPKDVSDLHAHAADIKDSYGLDSQVIEKQALAEHGMKGPFYGAVTVNAGFALNPRKYIDGLAKAAEDAGAVIYQDSEVSDFVRIGRRHQLETARGKITADKVIVATNGYSSEDLPLWLRGRYLPSQSNIIVTRPLTDDELAAQGWNSDQMSYDTRDLLHYFRLMPDRRFLFGMRGGVLTGAAAERRAYRAIRSDFEAMFPAWAEIETPYSWSGMVCLARDRLPFAGPIPAEDGLFVGMCYHGNGVAMGTYVGKLLASLAQGKKPEIPYPDAISRPLKRFELGAARRLIMPVAYAALMLADR